MNYYEVLGIPTDATPDEVRHAYLAKRGQLPPERFGGAPADVLSAVRQASLLLDAARDALGGAASRAQYDAEIAAPEEPATSRGRRSRWRRRHAEHVWAMERELGLPLSSVLGLRPPKQAPLGPEGLVAKVAAPSEEWLASPLYDPLAGLERVADWLAPHAKASRDVEVPDVCGRHASEAFYVVARADLRINFVRLTESQTGEGVVVGQDPAAGTSVRRNSTLTVQVVYPSKEPGRS